MSATDPVVAHYSPRREGQAEYAAEAVVPVVPRQPLFQSEIKTSGHVRVSAGSFGDGAMDHLQVQVCIYAGTFTSHVSMDTAQARALAAQIIAAADHYDAETVRIGGAQ